MPFKTKRAFSSYMRRYRKRRKGHLTKQRHALEAKKYRSFSGHVTAIFKAVKKFAKSWKLPISSMKDFKAWSMGSTQYREVFERWENSGYSEDLAPTVKRNQPKLGYVISNLIWTFKQAQGISKKQKEAKKALKEHADDFSLQQRKANELSPKAIEELKKLHGGNIK